jgi:hypothetical protein
MRTVVIAGTSANFQAVIVVVGTGTDALPAPAPVFSRGGIAGTVIDGHLGIPAYRGQATSRGRGGGRGAGTSTWYASRGTAPGMGNFASILPPIAS